MFVCEVLGRRLLGGRSMVGHAALNRAIGVRIPASQPSYRERIGRSMGTHILTWNLIRRGEIYRVLE